MPKTVKINGIDKTDIVIKRSIRISDNLNERSTASIGILDKTGSYRPQVGESVEIWDGTEQIFGGSIDDLEEEKIPGNTALRYDSIPLVDHHQTTDRKLVAETYENEYAGNIVKDIITKYLSSDGITIGTIQDGQIIKKAVFNYIYASQCFDEISELTGLQWVIRPNKSFDFFDRTTFEAPFNIEESSDIRNVKVRRDRENYRNKQYLRAGHDISAVQIRTFKGDGESQVFTVDLPIAKVPTIKVNGVAKTAGIRGLETGFDWYWQKNDKTISQDNSGVKLTSSDILTIEFQGFYPIMIISEDPEAIIDRQNIEGGSGVYESIEEKTTIDNRDAALDYTGGLLRKYAKISKTLTLDTYTPGLKAGQLITVNLPIHGINNEQMLISKVNISDPGFSDGNLNYSVDCLDGEVVGGWINFFKKIVQQGKTFVIRENEILLKSVTFKDHFSVPTLEDGMTFYLHQYKLCGQLSDEFVFPWQPPDVITCGEDVII